MAGSANWTAAMAGAAVRSCFGMARRRATGAERRAGEMERGVASRGVVAGAGRRGGGAGGGGGGGGKGGGGGRAGGAGPAKADLQRNSTASRRASSRAMSTKL